MALNTASNPNLNTKRNICTEFYARLAPLVFSIGSHRRVKTRMVSKSGVYFEYAQGCRFSRKCGDHQSRRWKVYWPCHPLFTWTAKEVGVWGVEG